MNLQNNPMFSFIFFMSQQGMIDIKEKAKRKTVYQEFYLKC